MNIAFNKPYFSPKCSDFVSEVLYEECLDPSKSFTNRVIKLFEKEFNLQNIILTSSCSSALFSIALTLSQQFKGTILLPSYTFTTTAAVFESVGFNIEYIDIDQDTLCIDVAKLDYLKNKNIIAIVNVNYASYVRNHEQIRDWCNTNKVLFIEDAAHGFDSKLNYPAAKLSDFATFSFHSTKNITCGEGGAIVVNNLDYLDRIMFSLNKGTNRHNFLIGKIDKYEWVARGSNFLLSEMHAAILYANLINYHVISKRRQEVWSQYYEALTPIFDRHGWEVNPSPKLNETLSNHIFFVKAPNQDARDKIHRELIPIGIPLQPHYPPLHLSPYGTKFKRTTLPTTENIANVITRFPMHSLLTSKEIDYTCDMVKLYFQRRLKS